MRKKPLFLLLGGLLLGLAAGCQNTVNRVENEEKTMTPNTITDKRFVTDGFLRDRLQLTRIDTAESADGFMRVQITAVNVRTGAFAQMWSSMTGENPYKIQYKFSWFTKDGMAVDTIVSTWKEMTIIPGEMVHIQSVAPTRDCKDFLINLKEAE